MRLHRASPASTIFFVWLLYLFYTTTSAEILLPTLTVINSAINRYTSGLPSPVAPNPAYATSKLRPIIYGAPPIISGFPSYVFDHNIPRTPAIGLWDREAWVYFTTSDYDVRSYTTTVFDDAFEEITPPEIILKHPDVLYAYVDCATDDSLCTNSTISPLLRNGIEVLREGNIETVMRPQGLLHIKICNATPGYNWNGYTSVIMYRYFQFPLDERRRQGKVEIEMNGDGQHKVEVPTFPSAKQQMRIVISGKGAGNNVCARGDGSSELWEGEGEWVIIREPEVEIGEDDGYDWA